VLSELDRLGRSQTEMLQLFNELIKRGVYVNVIGGPIPFDTRQPGPVTEMAKALLLFLGQVELIYQNERVAAARESGKTAHRPRKLTPQLEEDLAGEFCSGTPVNRLAAKYGVSRATVYRIAREHQVKTSSRRACTTTGRGKSLTPGQIGTARQLRAGGLSIRAIADAVGSSRATVHRALNTALTADLTTEPCMLPSPQTVESVGSAWAALRVARCRERSVLQHLRPAAAPARVFIEQSHPTCSRSSTGTSDSVRSALGLSKYR
jgi:DNA invertase Pin-like site-specific DNA recombinase